MENTMYYLINNGSDLSLGQQIAQCDTFYSIATAKKVADLRKDRTGDNWEVLEIKSVYTTQTLHEALMDAEDVPYMARG
jgi:hypothetical protein